MSDKNYMTVEDWYEVREDIYERTKDMTDKELLEWSNTKGIEAHERAMARKGTKKSA